MARLLRSRSVVGVTLAAVALTALAALTAARASTVPSLPAVSPEGLLASALAAAADPSLTISGRVQTHVDLGVPQLPGNLANPAGPEGLLLGDQTFRVWRSPDGARIAQLLPFAERDLVVSPAGAWFWDSQRFQAWHIAAPAGVVGTPPSLGDVDALAAQVLRRAQAFASVSVAPPERVAGRDAYVLRVTPSPSSSTLIGHIDVAIDAQSRFPLRVEVFSRRAATPAVRAGFNSVSFGPVDPSTFDFRPPDDAVVHQVTPGAGQPTQAEQPFPTVRCFGRGFGLVIAVSVPDVPDALRPLFPYAGPIASADVVSRGDRTWIVAGLVPPEVLAAAESHLR